ARSPPRAAPFPYTTLFRSAEALRERRRAVDGRAAVHGVAQPVGERPDARAAELALRGLLEQRVARDLAEVPALAVQVDGLPVDAVLSERELVERGPDVEHVLLRVVAHEVEAEPVDLVVLGPRDDRVHHELARHRVLGRSEEHTSELQSRENL